MLSKLSMIFCSFIDRVMNFFKMSTSLVAGFISIFSIYIVNGAPLMNADVAQQAPDTDSADHLSMFIVSEIMENMTLNDIGTEGGNVVDESLCKSILTILSSSEESETFKLAVSNIKDITGSYKAQKTIIRKMSATLQLCQRLDVTEIDIQTLSEKLERTIFEEIRVERVPPIESNEVNETKNSEVSTNLDNYVFVNSSEDNLKSDHVNVSRSLDDEPEHEDEVEDDSVPHFRSLEEAPARKSMKGRNASQYFFPKPLVPDSEDTSNTLLPPGRKQGSSNAKYDDMASKIFLFDGHVGPSFDPAAKEKKGQKTKFLFNRNPFTDYSKVSANLERRRKGSKIKNVD
ncbi:uncharacterized protein LOC135839792 [Planococcus citri]|uniref:uncharacterized protein LOC135839792 n=1 Tax=Planococcus citri TaxID=170843 RepID=UPI0031F909DD